MPGTAMKEEAQDTQHDSTANHAWQQPNDRLRNQENNDTRLGRWVTGVRGWVGLLPISSKASG
jgi:hypothetical protein